MAWSAFHLLIALTCLQGRAIELASRAQFHLQVLQEHAFLVGFFAGAFFLATFFAMTGLP